MVPGFGARWPQGGPSTALLRINGCFQKKSSAFCPGILQASQEGLRFECSVQVGRTHCRLRTSAHCARRCNRRRWRQRRCKVDTQSPVSYSAAPGKVSLLATYVCWYVGAARLIPAVAVAFRRFAASGSVSLCAQAFFVVFSCICLSADARRCNHTRTNKGHRRTPASSGRYAAWCSCASCRWVLNLR